MKRFVAAGLVCLLFTAPAFAATPDNALEKNIAAALKSNAAALSNFEMHYTLERKPIIPEDEFLRAVVSDWIKGDRCFLHPTNVELRYSQGKCHIRTLFDGPKIKRSQDGKSIELDGIDKWTLDVAFDGKIYYSGNSNSSKMVLIKDTIEDLSASAFHNNKSETYFAADMLEYAGFRLPRSYSEFSSPQLTSLPLHLLEGGAKVEESRASNAKYVKLRLVNKTDVYVFELDPQLGYAVLSQEKWQDGALVYQSKMSDFKQFAKSAVPFPQRVDVDFYQWGKKITGAHAKPIATETYQVTKMLDRPLADDLFGKDIVTIYSKPGTFIGDGTLPAASELKGKQVGYIIPDDAKDLEQTIKDTIDKAKKKSSSRP